MSTKTILSLVLILLLPLGGGAAATEMPPSVALDGFWYYNGFLADKTPGAGYTVIPAQPVALHADRDAASRIVGTLPPGKEATLLALCYIAHPGLHPVTIRQPLSSPDGTKTLQPGETVGYISIYGGDALAVYHRGEIIAVEALGVELPPNRKEIREAENQWLYLSDRQGTSGWCQYATDGHRHNARWRINTAAAVGGSADLNPIVFGNFPQFQRLTTLLTQQ
ncbi:hypothetical protein [Anaeroselena agilis]|uniref:Uncharacterized protein n=1 Tax=Anaeroselena agilis TaxID=3063788 RepID=A0ABU3NV84_9FIRM|nr:hypothetical protein [Selenomonadales bacterium 4137-cl]